MLSKEEYKKALDNIKLNYDAEYVNKCNDEFCQAMKGYISVIENLIKEHFELVEKYEMLENTYSMFCEDYLNPQPYKFEDLKADMYLYDAKKNEIIYLFKPLDWEPTKGLRYSYEKIDHSAYGFYMDFEDNRFYPVYIAK